MSILQSIKARIPASLKRRLRQHTVKARLAGALGPFLPQLTCVDVGASYYPHGKWHILLESPATRWVAIEPNQDNLGYVNGWPYPCQISAITTGLSRQGGSQTLFITNVDTGSSLLEPKISPSMARRVRNIDYFFPFQRQTINTLTLRDVLEQHSPDTPSFIKLDTQGTELSILQGADDWLVRRQVLGVELESTLLADPIMQGSGKFWQVCQYFEDRGYELLDVKPIYGPSRLGNAGSQRSKTYLNECDAVFAVRQDVAAKMSIEYRTALLAFYLCNQLFEEGLSLLDDDREVAQALNNKGCDLVLLRRVIYSLV